MPDTKQKSSSPLVKTLVSVAFLAACGVVGMGAYWGLSALYRPPQEEPNPELPLHVEALRAQPEEAQVLLRGFGTAQAVEVAPLSAQVPGKVVQVHPDLKEGGVIDEGELIFQIEPDDYQLALSQAEAKMRQAKNQLERLRTEHAANETRVATLRRTMELARKEFERDRQLYEEKQLGSESQVHLSETRYNEAKVAYDQVKTALDMFPIHLDDAENAVETAQLALDRAQLELNRTTVESPFDGRVKMVQVEKGQMVGPGTPLVMLANDSILEISVPLDSKEARQWLRFEARPARQDKMWFGDLEPVECEVTWSQGGTAQHWAGELVRVERFDPRSRTVTVTVQVDGAQDTSGPPLVEGMFCEVAVPGQTLEEVYRLPRWAVTYDSEVYLAVRDPESEEYRLERRPVTVARHQGEVTFVSGGIEPDELIVTTKLYDALPRTLLSVDKIGTTHGSDGAQQNLAQQPEPVTSSS